MILVADAGGTKTHWRRIDGDSIEQFDTTGFNPNSHKASDFCEEIGQELTGFSSGVTHLYFYGAGLSYPDASLEQCLKSYLPEAEILQYSDVLGACRGLAGDEPGFVGILGTGSAGCFYDGQNIMAQRPSLGYLLGDEGSGASLGRQLLKKIYREELDQSIIEAFKEKYQLKKEKVYQKVYREPYPNRFLASFVPFLVAHTSHSQVYQLIKAEFETYFDTFLRGMEELEQYPVHFSGSIAFFFSNFLQEITREQGLTMGRVVQSPIAGLALYHQKNG